MKKDIHNAILDVWSEPRIDYVESVKVNKRKRKMKLMWISISVVSFLGLLTMIYNVL